MKNIALVTMMVTTTLLLFLPINADAKKVHASWYQCCKRTANGERFNPDGFTAAHRTLKFGTRVKITYKGRSVIVRINDRGPFIRGRQIDLSRGAARKIRCPGTCQVDMQIVK